MTLERAMEFQDSGDLVRAEDLYWSEIENGNDYARLLLAFMFHDAGLLTLATDHYEVLLKSKYRDQAGPQLSSILLEAHRYIEAREAIADLDAEDSLEAIKSVENKTYADQADYPRAIENLLEEERVLINQLEENVTLESQQQLCQVRTFLAEYSSRLTSGKANVAAATQIQLHGGVVITLNESMLAPSRRWFELAHAQTVLFTLTGGGGVSREDFEVQVMEALKSLEMKFLFSGRVLTEQEEDWVVNNLSWGLQEIGNSAWSFLPN